MTAPGGTDTRNAQVNLGANVDPYVQQMDAAARSTDQASSAVDRLDSRLEGLSKRAGKKLLHFSAADFAVLAGATADAAAFDKQLSSLNATASITGTSFKGIKNGIESAFEKFPTARGQIVALAESITDLGVTAPRDINSLVATFIKLGAASGENIQPLASGLVQLSRLMGTTNAQQIGNYANSLLVVAKNSGVSATGVLNFAQSIAPMARQAGIGEAAVLGISAAFSKAGADGYVAANTFNSIVSDITNLTQSGSPELSKYANLIGVTVGQFKSMDKTTALVDIFNTIAKQGPAAINTLNRLGIDGTRAQSAIAAVVQSGGLQQAIGQAQGASGDQTALNKGSKAAFDNLSDDLTRLRHQFSQLGTEIGETFIKPLDFAVSKMATAAAGINALIKPFAPLIAILAAVAGGLAAVGGAALTAAGVIGTVSLARLAIRSGPVRALREGIATGRAGPRPEGFQGPVSETETRYVAGTLPGRARRPYEAGRVIGEGLGPRGAAGTAEGEASAAAQAGRYAVRAPTMIVSGVSRMQRRTLDDSAQDDYNRRFYTTATPGFRASMKDSVAQNKVNTESMTTGRAMASELRAVTIELGRFAASLARAGVVGVGTLGGLRPRGDATAALVGRRTAAEATVIGRHRPGDGMLPARGLVGASESSEDVASHRFVGTVRSSAGRAAGSGASALGGVGSFLGGPIGLALIGSMVAGPLISHFKDEAAKPYEIEGGANSISRYDKLLGTTSSNLADFSKAVTGATAALAGPNAPTSLASAAKVAPSDTSAVSGNYHLANTQIASVAKGAGGTDAAVEYIKGLAQQSGGLSPDKLQAIKLDLIKTYGADQAQAILTQYMQSAPTGRPGAINYATLGANANGLSEGRFTSLTGNAASDIVSQKLAGGPGANQAALAGLLQYGGTALQGQGGNAAAQASFRDALSKVVGGTAGDYNLETGMTTGSSKVAAKRFGEQRTAAFSTSGSTQAQILKTIRATAAGRAYLDQNFGAGASDSDILSAMQNNGRNTTAQTAYQQAVGGVGGSGGLGQFALNNSAIQAAQSSPNDANAQGAGVMALYNQASSLGQNFQQISQTMDDFKGAIKDSTDPLYQMAQAAKDYAAAQDQYAQQGMSREGQLGDLSANYKQAQATAAGNLDPDAQKDLLSAQAAYQQGLTSYAQYEQSMTSAAISFGTQMSRAQEDQNTTLARNALAFRIQQTQADEDYNRQKLIATRDFGIQMERQAQSDAESIYDPYHRVTAQTTASAASLVENLQDENSRITKQYQQLQQLQAMGVSQSSIDTLKLSDPSNAQQLNNVIAGIMADPTLVAQINSAVGTRIAATTQLTQSSFSETFRNTTSDFARQLSDTADAYDIQKQRAIDSQALSLSQMAEDYNKMVSRSAADLGQSFTQIYGDYATSYDTALSTINADIGKYAPAIATQLSGEITAMQAQLAALINPSSAAGYQIYSATSQPGYVASGSYNNNPSSYQHAAGGVSTFSHKADISEGNKPEAIIPLDQRGAAFMAGFANQVSMALLNQMNAKAYPSQPTGGGQYGGGQRIEIDQSMRLTGPVSITANNTDQIQAELAKAKRLKALSQPPAATAGG